MESLKNIIGDLRIFLYGGVLNLPLVIAGTALILGLFTANYALLFFLIGFLILTPIASGTLNAIVSLFSLNIFKAKSGDICNLIIPYSTMKNSANSTAAQDTFVISSYWTAMVAFFIGYMFTNALELYGRESSEVTLKVKSSDASDIQSKVTTRKTQATVAMISILIFALVVLGLRFYTGCESTLGLIITTLLFVFFGNGWYSALSSVGQDRLSDLFGIANRLLPPSAIVNAPIGCVPMTD